MTAIILRLLGCLVIAGHGLCPRMDAAEASAAALLEDGMAGNEAVAEDVAESGVSVAPEAEGGGSGDGWVHASAVPGDILINEVLAQNVSGLTDELGVPQAWIELYNPGAAAVNLKGWSLTDDAQLPGKWVFPGVTIPARAYWVIFASGRDLKPTAVGGKLHTNFKLDPRGEYLGLYSPGTPPREISGLAPRYPEQRGDYSYGRDAGGQWRYYGTPTPGAANGESTITGKVAAVHFSAERGFYGLPFQLSLSTATPGAAIRYTKDGSVPTERRGQRYTGSIRIESNQVIRAAAFGTNSLPSAVATHTYLYGLPANRRLLPALCLATATNNLWGTNGIMEVSPRNTTKRGMAWERPVSVELLRTQDNGGFHTDCGLRVQGGDYVRGLYNPKGAVPFNKYSLRLYFRGAYGDSHLDYPLYSDCAVARFDEVSLRAGMNDPTNPFIRDEVVRRLFADTGQVSAHGTFVNLFINGVYKGYYNPAERIGVDFLQAWHGGGDQWDLIAQGSQVREGDATTWNALRTYVNGKDLTVAANYQEVGRRLDLVNFIDYLLVNIYVASDDWPGNNWRAARERVAGAPFRFYVWDAEWAFGYSSHTVTWNTLGSDLAGTSEIPQLYKKLKTNAEFRLLFADRAHRHFFNDGALTDARIRARYEAVKGEVASSITGFNDVIGRTWIPGRRPYVLKHLANANLLASSNAPGFSAPGGRVTRGLALTLTATNGAIWYTTNGADPRVPFVNGVSAEAARYVAGAPILVNQDVRIKARTLAGTNWSAVTEAAFQPGEPRPSLRLAEIMYHPPGGGAYEYLELLNAGGVPVDLSGMSFEGITYRFAEDSPPLAPGGRLLLISDADPAAFARRYPWAVVGGAYQGSLNNAGQSLVLKDRSGQVLLSVAYQDGRGWPAAADGGGYSLEFAGSSGEEGDPARWRASAQPGGSPGAAGDAAPEAALVLNEILARSGAAPAVAGGRAADWIELYNGGAGACDLGGMSVSINSLDPGQWTIPEKTVMAPKSYLVLWCDSSIQASVNYGPELNLGHNLDGQGGAVHLFSAAGRLIDTVAYGFQVAGRSIGRAEGAWQLLARPTPGAANAPAAALGLPGGVRINEWMAGDPTRDDWFELYNPGPLPVSLAGLYLSDDPSLAGQAKFPVGPLAYLAGPGWVQWVADGQTAKGRNHAGFKLDGQGESLRLYDSGFRVIDSVDYAAQIPGTSEGRLPDGEAGRYVFYQSPTPGSANAAVAGRPETMQLRLAVADGEGGVTLRLANAPTDTALVLQTSGNLVDWVSIRTNAVPEGIMDLRDESFHQETARFYRVMAVH